jgi:Methyltransferase FkbM domain
VLYTNEDGSPLASLYPHRSSGADGANLGVILDKQIPTTLKTIDTFLEEQAISHIDIMKIDTEGHEFDVLIDCLFWEFGMHQVESRHFFIDFYLFFKELDYDLYLTQDQVVEPITKYSYVFENFTSNFNFAATRKGVLPEWFSEDTYLSDHPDVMIAVQEKQLPSGLYHWINYEKKEGRLLRR